MKCHRSETQRYLSTAMGQSLVPRQSYPDAVVKHPQSGSVISVTTQNGTMFHRVKENGFISDYPIRYQVGGGMQGSTFLIEVRDYLFESPLSWYNGFGWDLSPGYESKNVLEFDRVVLKACLYCHSTGARFDDPDGRHLISNLQPITCERCHGPSEEHVRHPVNSNIVNPAKLSGPARDSVCEQCHLEGTIRVLNPGKDWTDFHPGQAAENIFATYVLLGNEKPEVPLASEVEQFAESRCMQASQGKFWCGSCHNPHRAPQPRALEIRQVCTSCHQQLSPSAHPAGLRECTSCHMPTTTKVTISHASHTDHRILRHPSEGAESSQQQQKLVAWREPPEQFRQRNLGLAELLLSSVENEDLWHEGANLLLELKPEALNRDPDAVSELEDYCFRSGDISNAVEFGRRSVELNPRSATAALTFARILEASGAGSQAEEQFLRAISLDPSLKEAYGRLSIYYEKQQRTRDAINILDRYLQWNPNEIAIHEMKQKLLSQHGSAAPKQ